MMINTIEEAISRLRYVQLDSDFSLRHILHMILAGGPSRMIYNVAKGIFQSALEFLCTETRNIPNYPIPGGIVKEDADGHVYFSGGPRQFEANEHLNEFLGTFATAGIGFKTTRLISDKGNEFTLMDLAESAARSHKSSDEEMSWSIMTFAIHPGVSAEWENEFGEVWSVERILEQVCRRPYGQGSCFGTHVIEGVSFAVSRYCLEKDLEPQQLEGIWHAAFKYLQGAIRLMKANQKDDGSMHRCWFKEKRYPRTWLEWTEEGRDILSRRYTPARAIVYPTGHCLDALSPLSMFLGAERDWINSACYIVAQTIENQWMELAKEISPLTHGIHALKTLGD